MRWQKWLRFSPGKETALAVRVGVAVIIVSVLMQFTGETGGGLIARIVLRNLVMLLLLGFCWPLYYVLVKSREGLAALGVTRRKLKISLLVNVVLGAALLALFVSESGQTPVLDLNGFYAISYILAAGIFEMVFIYGYLRHYFEKAFGIIPAIVLTAVFYSLHHAGFQPEFGKLIGVGLMYVTVFYFTRNIFIIFPFYWGVGAVWDVLALSPAGEVLRTPLSLWLALAVLFGMLIYSIWLFMRLKGVGR